MLWPRRVWWVALDRTGLASSPDCASCGQLRPAASEYCSTCGAAHAEHAGAALVLGATGALFGLALALGFPLLWPRAGLAWHLVAAGAAALLPIAGLGSGRRALGGAPPRTWWLGEFGGLFERGDLARRLAAASDRTPRALRLPPLAYRVGWWPLPALALALAAFSHAYHHPRLTVVNLTDEPLRLLVDGVTEAELEPAGVDVARALVELRLPRGERELAAAAASGRIVATARARLESGQEHLYAPASDGHCFWLQVTGYGRDATDSLRPLVAGTRFFALPADIDAWFTEPPEPPRADRRSSGGTLTTLRQSPCARAPEAVRRAASAIGP